MQFRISVNLYSRYVRWLLPRRVMNVGQVSMCSAQTDLYCVVGAAFRDARPDPYNRRPNRVSDRNRMYLS